MALLDDIKRAISGEADATERVASTMFQYASVVLDPAYKELYSNAVLPWMQRMSETIPSKWYHPSVRRTCAVKSARGTCHLKAAGMCTLCQRDVCLSHSFVHVDGSLLCAHCVMTAKKYVEVVINTAPGPEEMRRPEPVKNDRLAEAYKLLGVTPDIEDDLLKAVYTKLLQKHHPDRASTHGDKSISEAKFKAIRSAYDTIKAARQAAA